MDKDILSDAKERFQLSEDGWADNRQMALEDIKFAKLGEQWPHGARTHREKEGRPCLTINKMPAFIRQVVNDARINRPSIKVHPVDSSADVKTAKVITELIRNIEYSSNADVAYDTAIEYAVAGGFGFWRVDVDYATDDAFDTDLFIRRINNPLSVHPDPFTQEADSSDWDFCFISDMLSEDQFLKQYPGAEKSDFASDKDLLWTMDKQVRVAEYWERDEIKKTILLLSDGSVVDEKQFIENKDLYTISGIQVKGTRETKAHKIIQRIITGAEVLETNAWHGKYIPIVPCYGDEFSVEGKRYFYSLIRHARDAQQMFNYWRTASTELVALAPKTPFIGPVGAFDTDSNKWASANTASHSYIEYDGQVPPQRQPFAGVPAGHLQEAMNASDDMKAIMGLFDASIGARSNETSGRAILARQREGDVSTFHFIDNLARAQRHCGRILLDLIPKVYSKARVLRLMGEDGSPHMAPANQKFQQDDGTIGIYDLTAGKYDLTISTGPSFTTRREEAATQMTEMVRAFPQAATIIGDLIAKNLDWPGADEIAERMKAMLPQQLQGKDGLPPAARAIVMQLQNKLNQLSQAFEQGKGLVGKLQAEVNDKQAETAIKAKELEQKDMEIKIKQQEAAIKQFDAETKRLDTEIKAIEVQPPQLDMQPIFEQMAMMVNQLQDSLACQVEAAKVVGVDVIRDENNRIIGGVRKYADGSESEVIIQ